MKFCYLMEENGVGALGGAVWGAGSYSVGQLWKGLFG